MSAFAHPKNGEVLQLKVDFAGGRIEGQALDFALVGVQDGEGERVVGYREFAVVPGSGG
jgi:hypothetical protein